MAINPIASLALLAAFPAVLLASQPASQSIVTVPEPTDLLLFSLGVTGLIIGRRAAMKRKDKDEDSPD